MLLEFVKAQEAPGSSIFYIVMFYSFQFYLIRNGDWEQTSFVPPTLFFYGVE